MVERPIFSCCVITKNGARTLPRLAASLKQFLERGGEWVVVSTGSTDGSVELARSLGATVVEEAGERFMKTIDQDLAAKINDRFVVEGDDPIVVPGSRLFHFSEARNYAAGLASNDWVSWADDDEAFTVLNIDKLNEILEDPGLEHCEYHFVFAHEADGVTPGMAFTQSKMYRRSRMFWTGAVHELLTLKPDVPPREYTTPNRIYLDPATVFHLEHWQDPGKEHRSNYCPGLGWDAFMKLTEDPAGARDRQFHYLARDMNWLGRHKSAIKLFKEHIGMNGWLAEKAQSMIFIGDAHGALGDQASQAEWYAKAFFNDPTRRESLIKMAYMHKARGNNAAVAAFASAAMEIPLHDFYANQQSHYRDEPFALRYFGRGWSGNIPGAREDILTALRMSPFHPDYNRDAVFYCGYDVAKAPEGWMVGPELIWLFDNAQGKKRILEVGSWKGRSTHALASGAAKTGGTVWAVDHFSGSVGEDAQHAEAKADPDSVYQQFLENLKEFSNVIPHRADSLTAAKEYPDGFFDLLFVDGGHRYEDVSADLEAWGRKCRGVLAGHDFFPAGWPGVVQAVREYIGGEPDGVECSVWWKKWQAPEVNALLAYLGRCVEKGQPVSFVKLGDGEQMCMDGAPGANCDGHPYTPDLAWALRMAFSELGKMSGPQQDGRVHVNIVPFKDQAFFNCLLHRNDSNLDAVKAFWGAIRESSAPKIFVGPERLKPVAGMLKADFVDIPLINAFSQHKEIKRQLYDRIKPGAIFVFSAGMPAKVWIANLLMANRQISCIDAGSAFDPILVGKTRTEQLGMDLLQREYGEWLK